MAEADASATAIKSKYPKYVISKNKASLTEDIDVDDILLKIRDKYKKQPINTIDGVRIEFDNNWVHLRKSNTEPIIRIYAESDSQQVADNLAKKILQDIGEFANN